MLDLSLWCCCCGKAPSTLHFASISLPRVASSTVWSRDYPYKCGVSLCSSDFWVILHFSFLWRENSERCLAVTPLEEQKRSKKKKSDMAVCDATQYHTPARTIDITIMPPSEPYQHGEPTEGMCCLCTMEDITIEDKNYGERVEKQWWCQKKSDWLIILLFYYEQSNTNAVHPWSGNLPCLKKVSFSRWVFILPYI